MNPFALTGQEQHGGALMQPAQAPAFMDNLEALRAMIGPSARSRMMARDAEQQARAAGGDWSPTPLDEDNMWLADDVAGSFLGPIGGMAGVIKAFHGTPHRFDRFSMDKIGTGEGAQAYGRGLYFAENESVANDYRRALAKDGDVQVTFDGAPAGPARIAKATGEPRAVVETALDDLKRARGNYGRAKEMARETWPPDYAPNELAAEIKALDAMERGGVTVKDDRGALYTTRLNVKPDDLLDWDAPLSQQSEKVRAALERLGRSSGAKWEDSGGVFYREGPRGTEGSVRKIDRGNRQEWLAEYDTLDGRGSERFGTVEEAKAWLETQAPIEGGRGAEIYQTMRKEMNDAEVTRILREAGIPGIRYLDQGSRATGEGTRNFVIFDDSLIEIEAVR